MAENIVIYAGIKKVGEQRKRAVEREASRRKMSVSDLVWEGLEKIASPRLKADLEKAKAL